LVGVGRAVAGVSALEDAARGKNEAVGALARGDDAVAVPSDLVPEVGFIDALSDADFDAGTCDLQRVLEADVRMGPA